MLTTVFNLIEGVDERKWQVSLVFFAVILAGLVSAVALAIANLQTQPPKETLPFPDFQPEITNNIQSGSLVLYRNFVMTDAISPETIVKHSYRIQLKGQISTGRLIVKASATERGYDPKRIHTVYFYIDDGRMGGHLGATRENSQITSGGFTIEGGGEYEQNFDLNNIPVAFGVDGKKYLPVIDLLNDKNPHYIGAFVATGIFGSLDELRIDFTCSEKTPDCTLQVL